MINQIINLISKNIKPKIFNDGSQIRDWVYVEDVLDANVLAANHNKTGIFNVGSGDTISFNDLVKTINKIFNKNLPIDYIDCGFKNSYQDNTTVNLDKSNKILGYYPKFKVDEGIQDLKNKLSKLKN